MKKRLYSILFTLFVVLNTTAQNSIIQGIVTDKLTGETLPGANVVLIPSGKGATTDFDGKFTIIADAGTYTVNASFVSYQPTVINNVIASKGKAVELQILLQETSNTIEDVTITATRVTNTEISMINAMRANLSIANGMSAQQIQRTPDRDAAEVVRRVPGITIIDDRFVIVRGLNQRYNGVWLNNAGVPGTEADSRAFSFDAVPSSLIDNLVVFKTPTAELPADYAGGFVKLTTKNMPDENFCRLSYSLGYAQGTTLAPFYAVKSSPTDMLGFDNGTRALPDYMPAHLNDWELSGDANKYDQIHQLSHDMNQNWTATKSTALPDQRFSVSFGNKFTYNEKLFGTTSAISYSNSYDSQQSEQYQYGIYNYITDSPNYDQQTTDYQYKHTNKVGVLHNWAWHLSNNSRLEFRNLLNQIGWSRTAFRDITNWSLDGRKERQFENKFQSRTVYASQLGGNHKVTTTGKIDWTVGFALSTKNEPDQKRYRQIRSDEDTTRWFTLFGSPSQPDLSSVSRVYMNMHETVWSASVNYLQPLTLGLWKPELRTGVYAEMKNRAFNARNFGYSQSSMYSDFGFTYLSPDQIFVADNFSKDKGIKLMEITNLSDSYTADNYQQAAYMALNTVIKKFTIYVGVRAEHNTQILDSYKQSSDEPVGVYNDTIHILPSANISYNITDKALLRVAAGVSLNRPEFRELAPFYFVDFDLNAGMYGNPSVRTAQVYNYDARWEYYPAAGQTISLGGFYKKFKNPIEMIIKGNAPMQYTFANVKESENYGAELEVRQSLDMFSLLKHWNLVANAAIIRSRVSFDEGSLQRQRPMQGQSPYIVNAGLFYNNTDKKINFSVLYNVVGKRIVAVGRPSPNQWEDIPNIYEMPHHQIDVQFSKKLGKRWEINGGVKDILNQPVEYRQFVNTTVDMSAYSEGTQNGIKQFNRSLLSQRSYEGRYVWLGVVLNL